MADSNIAKVDTVILSYDAAQKFYEIKHPQIAFEKLFAKKESFDFRVALLMILKNAGARRIRSYVATTIYFELYEKTTNNNPSAYLKKLFKNYFSATDFHFSFTVGEGRIIVSHKAKPKYKTNFDEALIKADENLVKHRIPPPTKK